MKKPSCKDCLHCKIRPDRETGLMVYCGKDAWPRLGHTEAYVQIFKPGVQSMSTQYADGCMHYEDMAI